jgi:hypothetical protein
MKQSTLDARRRELLLRSAELRVRVAWHGAELARSTGPVLAVADGTLSAARWLQAHPVAVATLFAVAAVRRPRAALRWVMRGLAAWRWLRIVRIFVRP